MGFLPFALGGGAWFLYLLNYNLSVAVGVGFIALAGIAVQDSVLMVEFLNNAVKKYNSTKKDLINLITDAASQRVRPIIMTTCSTIVGLLQIMFIDGTGSSNDSRRCTNDRWNGQLNNFNVNCYSFYLSTLEKTMYCLSILLMCLIICGLPSKLPKKDISAKAAHINSYLW